MDEKEKKRKEYLKKYFQKNKEKKRLYLQKWREKNKDKAKEYSKRDREKNKEKISNRRKTPEARAKMLSTVKKWRLENREKHLQNEKAKKDRSRFKINARFRVTNAVRRGKMTRPTKCQICGYEGLIEAHHDDYSKPLEVKWLCFLCHKKQHNKLLDKENNEQC